MIDEGAQLSRERSVARRILRNGLAGGRAKCSTSVRMSDANISASELLTERERACLRLVKPAFQEKVIAEQLGISHHTVKVHLRSARMKFRVSSSIAAAELLAKYEGRAPPGGISTASGMADMRSSTEEADTPFPIPAVGSASAVKEDGGQPRSPVYMAPDASPTEPRGVLHGFTVLQRLMLTALAVLFLILAIVSAPALYASFQQVANSLSPPEQ